MRKSKDSRGSVVYLLVDMLKMHLRYETDAETEKSIGKDLKRLYREGNNIIDERKARFVASKASKKRKRGDTNNGVQHPESGAEKDDDDDHEYSEREGEEDDDDNHDEHNSVSAEEKEEDEEEDEEVDPSKVEV